MKTQVRSAVVEFVVANYLFGDVTRIPMDGESLVDTGIVDSTGILELIEFVESTFGVAVTDAETVPENLGSIAALVEFVSAKRTDPA